MKTITKETKVLQPTPDEAIKWLQDNHANPQLVYIDYRDELDAQQLQEVLKYGYLNDENWIYESQDESIDYIMREYIKEIESSGDDIEEVELTDDTRDAMRQWLQDNDTSDIYKQLLRNTGDKLFFISTTTELYPAGELNEQEREAQFKMLYKKYGNTEEQKKEIRNAINNQFYQEMLSFYFYVSPQDIYKIIHGENSDKYITIKGAYFSTIDRSQGSNWLGDEAIFDITLTREAFIDNLYLDRAKGNGYSWYEIAGQSDYDEASISTSATKKHGYTLIEAETGEAQKREQRLQAQWDKIRTCKAGDYDKNWNRHKGDRPYRNEYPCGNKCETCGTFWID